MPLQHPIHRSSRRTLLKVAAGSALLAPFVRFGRASGDPVGRVPQHFVVVTWPEGLEPGWEPPSPGNLGQLSGPLAPLDGFRERLLLVGGLKGGTQNILLAHSEGTLSLWTGATPKNSADLHALPTRLSIDQAVATKIGGGTPYRSLHFGAQTNRLSYISTPYLHFAGDKQPIPAEDDPHEMYKLVFAGLAEDPLALDAMRAKQRSVLDFVKGRLAKVRAGAGAEDRDKLDKHVEGVRAIERSLDGLAASCGATLTAPTWTKEAALSDDSFPAVIRLQTDLMVAALQCGLTRVTTLQLSNTDSQTKIPGLTTTRTVHEAQHSGTAAERAEIGAFFVRQLAYVLQRLDGVAVGDGETLLDRTLVVMGSEMAAGSHWNDPMPFLLAGARTSTLPMGRYVQPAGTPQHTKLLTSIAHAMGMNDVATFGDYPGADAQGALAELA